MKRSGMPPRKKPMNRGKGFKRKPPRYPPAELKRARKAWEKKQSNCHVCRARRDNRFCTHHIAFRSFAPGRWEHPCNWLWICFDCHHYLHNHGGNEHAKMLEFKRQADPENYSKEAWLEITRKPASYLE